MYDTVRRQIREQRWSHVTSEVSGSSRQVQEDTERILHDIEQEQVPLEPQAPEEVELMARVIGKSIACALGPMRLRPEAQIQMAWLKLKDLEGFDGKTMTAFNIGWESIMEYIGFYLDTTDWQRIAWVGTLLNDKVKAWHQHHRQELGDRDTWPRYTAAIQEEY